MKMNKVLRASETITFRKGKPPKNQVTQRGGDELPYLTPEYLRGNEMADLAFADTSSVIIEDGDLILLWDGSNAGEFFVGRKGILSSTMVVLNSRFDFDRQFLFFTLKAQEAFLKGQTSGSGIPHVDKEIFANLSITYFEKKVQTCIAAVLSCMDRAIEQIEAIIAKQQRIKTGLMQDLFTKGIDESGSVRSETTHKFKESPLGRIPKESVIYGLGEVCERTMVGLAVSVTPYYRETGVPIVRNLNIKNGYFDDEDMLNIDPAFSARNKSKSVRANDVITVRTGANLGLTCLVPNDFDGAQTFTTLIITPNRQFLLPSYLVFHMNSDKGIAQIEQLKAGGGKSNLNVGELNQYRIALPPISEQQRVIKVLNQANSAVRRHEPLLKKLQSAKQGLMQDLLTGNVSIEGLLAQHIAVIA